MIIAVASQNRREITEHTERCRKFWIYNIEKGDILNKQLLELPKEQCFHDCSPHDPSTFDDMQVLISGGMAAGLVRRLNSMNVGAVITTEIEPDNAVKDYLKRTLNTKSVEPHEVNHQYRDK